MGVRLAAAAKSMNSWTCFLHGDGGAPLVNLNKTSKTSPMFRVKSSMYFSNDPS